MRTNVIDYCRKKPEEEEVDVVGFSPEASPEIELGYSAENVVSEVNAPETATQEAERSPMDWKAIFIRVVGSVLVLAPMAYQEYRDGIGIFRE